MADTNQPPIIVIKKVKKGGHGHHGGAWKVAYADFVTAMMAFFLLLWLLGSTTDEQKLGISDYFSPEAVSIGQSGAGGLFGGTSLAVEGALTSAGGASVGAVSIPLPPSEPQTAEDDGEDGEDGDGGIEDASREALEEQLAEREQEQFEAAESALRQAILELPELVDLQESLVIDQTPEGLRIQLVDQEGVSMFASGSAKPNEHTRRLIAMIAKVVTQLPNKISVSGHTDSVPFRSASGYSNWELSADRANAARRLLLESGLDTDRIAGVQGLAATDPLLPDDPTSPRNRRVSIVLLRESKHFTEPEVGPLPPSYGE